MKIWLLEVQAELIMKDFTEQNAFLGKLNNYLYLDNRRMKRLDTCDKFVEAYGHCLKMFMIVKEKDKNLLEEFAEAFYVELNPTDSRSVAKWVNSGKHIFFAKKSLENEVYIVKESSVFIEMLNEKAKFYEMTI